MLSNTLCDVILQIHLVDINSWLILLGRVPATGTKNVTHFCSGKLSQYLPLLLLDVSVCRAVIRTCIALSVCMKWEWSHGAWGAKSVAHVLKCQYWQLAAREPSVQECRCDSTVSILLSVSNSPTTGHLLNSLVSSVFLHIQRQEILVEGAFFCLPL